MFDPAARELRRWLLANDPHRQRYHFTAPEGWINDPNGPIYQRGTYHLFYQYRRCSPTAAQAPSGATPAPDLLHWDDWPVAMWPDRRYDVDGVYSGNTLFRFEQLLMGMANEGEWRPVLEFLSEAIVRQTGDPRLHRRREGHSGVSGRLPECDRLLRIPLGGGAGEGTR